MKNIVILGAGKSTVYLYEYLAGQSAAGGWQILACDRDSAAIEERIPQGSGIGMKALDVGNEDDLDRVVQEADLVISMLPAFMHLPVARLCLKHGKHMATASYVSDELEALAGEVRDKGLVFLNEMGLDPGIDHMSAMRLLHQIRNEGGAVDSFESYCGGLILEEDCGNNPWKYKFSWNPRNVILAGQGGMSVFREQDEIRYIPWHRLFAHARLLDLGVVGRFDAYPNRDSLKYAGVYGLENAQTFLRGTLRRERFCVAWQVLVQLGFTDQEPLHHPVKTPGAMCRALTGMGKDGKFSQWLLRNGYIHAGLMPHFEFLESAAETVEFLPEHRSPAAMLQQWLEVLWAMERTDRDEVVMHHRLGYQKNGERRVAHSTLRLTGNDQLHTAMAKTVGLPLAMGAELILNGSVSRPGIHIPVTPEWYRPVLDKLESYGIRFDENM